MIENWKHDDLLQDLKSTIEKTGINGSRMVWVDIPMGSSGSQRPDLFSLEKSFSKPNPTAYEIKVSRSDFLADVTAGKWTGYLRFASRVIFCVPKDLIKKTEVPDKAGLMIRGANSWRTAKKAIVSGQKLGFEQMLKLLMYTDDLYRDRARQSDFNFFKIEKKIKKLHGEEISQIISDVTMAKYKIKEAEDRAERIVSRAKSLENDSTRRIEEERERHMFEYNAAINQVKEALGLKADSGRWETISAIKRIADALNGINHEKQNILRQLMRQSSQMTASLERAIDQLESIEKKALNDINQRGKCG